MTLKDTVVSARVRMCFYGYSEAIFVLLTASIKTNLGAYPNLRTAFSIASAAVPAPGDAVYDLDE